ncbi:MAG: ATP-binding protein [Aestuariivita sp.]|nr:ATP-binding protein [Aestuariivita sp.]
MSATEWQSVSRQKRLEPRASVLIESLRDIGYSLQTAISDVIDNSITAGAANVELLANTDNNNPAIGILDDGCGMLESDLLEAMRPGSQSPLEKRPDHDLGRFGLGLKTASFSQCRCLTVVTRRCNKTSCAVWDLDVVAKTDEWYVEIPDATFNIPWSDRLGGNGTLIVWQKLDRLIDPNDNADTRNLVRQLDEAVSHLELVFHRFLAGEPGLKRISISLNGRDLIPFDPFHSRHAATIYGPMEVIKLRSQKVQVQPFTLPHHNKVTLQEWDRYAGAAGYIKNQGFYLYREKRLILHGTWFNLARQSELTKLARVRIDVPNGMDAHWKIDVKKSSAQPPAPVRDRLKKIIETIGATSKRVYSSRGKKLTSDNQLPVWARKQNKNRIFYDLNLDHPVIARFMNTLDEEQECEFERILALIESTIPIDTLFADISSHPANVKTRDLDCKEFSHLVRKTFCALKSGDVCNDEIRLMMSSAEPFRSNWEATEELIREIEGGNET